jgi:hypothetical protein
MKKLLLLALLVVSFGLNSHPKILNGITVTLANGYNYKSKLSDWNQASFINSAGNKLKNFSASISHLDHYWEMVG